MENPYIEMLKLAQMQVQKNGISLVTNPLDEFGLGGINCDQCGNTGRINYTKNGILYSKDCDCMKRRLNKRNIERSGLSDLLERYTFDSYIAEDSDRKSKKNLAMEFASKPSGWFYIAGQPGSGKTHLCTAICGEEMENGKAVKYFVWREGISHLKALLIEDKDAYIQELDKLMKVDVLYIDDFFKGKVTETDFNLAFELLNARYNNSKLKTIISSELPIEKILDLDEALGSRIYERSKAYYIKAPNENWRMR